MPWNRTMITYTIGSGAFQRDYIFLWLSTGEVSIPWIRNGSWFWILMKFFFKISNVEQWKNSVNIFSPFVQMALVQWEVADSWSVAAAPRGKWRGAGLSCYSSSPLAVQIQPQQLPVGGSEVLSTVQGWGGGAGQIPFARQLFSWSKEMSCWVKFSSDIKRPLLWSRFNSPWSQGQSCHWT